MQSINSREINVGTNRSIPLAPNLDAHSRGNFAPPIGAQDDPMSRVHVGSNECYLHHFDANMIRVHKKFREKIDSLSIVQMCHVCHESYPGIQILRGSEGPICKMCKNE